MEDFDVLLWKESSKCEVVMFRKFGMLILDFENQYVDEFYGKCVFCNVYFWNKINDNEEFDILFMEVVVIDNSWYVCFVGKNSKLVLVLL